MDIKLRVGPWQDADADAVVVICFDKDSPRDSAWFQAVNQSTGGWLEELYATGEFPGNVFDLAVLHRPAGCKAKRLAVTGAGPRGKFGVPEMRLVVAAAARNLKGRGVRRLAVAAGPDHATPEFVQAAVEGAALGNYEPDQLITKPDKGEHCLTAFAVLAERQDPQLEEAARRGQILAEAQNFARDLVNEPANRLTPLLLADRAQNMAGEYGLECEILDQAKMAELGMGSLLGVAMGSAEPPALIVLRYLPPTPGQGHLGLIGKGVTFDTGGVSIKPAEGMEKMKYDMAGGAAVLGAMRAIAQLKPPVQVTALVPTVENMLGSRAQRPGDIVTSLSGKTVEVLNTDAEGRMILIDAITYAIRLGCSHLVDAATLTGAIVIALGHVRSGAFSNHDGFYSDVHAASEAAGEKLWRMPLDDEYKEYLKSAFADLPNIGGRWGGAITAAYFLKEFVENKPWVHLDIAGTAYLDDPKPFAAKGPSGSPVRTFVNLAMNWK